MNHNQQSISNRRRGRGIIRGLVVMALLSAWPALPVWAGSCVTSSCHPGITRHKNLHAPASDNECLSCHEQVSDHHPVSGQSGFRLVASGAALCFQCHEADSFAPRYGHGPVASGACTYCHDPHGADQPALLRQKGRDLCLGCHIDFVQGMAEANFVHSAVLQQECTACHQPHGGEHPLLLRKEGAELCFGCHDGIRERIRKAKSSHAAVSRGRGCGNCHQVHYSRYPKLLNKEEIDLCLGCHGKKDFLRSNSLRDIKSELQRDFPHGPIARGECVVCHDPHGSPYEKLLQASYPGSFYAPYKKGVYDLCFRCHDRGLLAKPETLVATGFRNGGTNLHYLHVARKRKGRTCQACHQSHGSDGAKLINQKGARFGEWTIPLGFKKTSTGGSCVPGCHRAVAYDREQPVDYRAAPEEGGKDN